MTVRIVEWQLPYTAWDGIEITANKVIKLLLRQENNLIMLNDDNEIYTDLQLADWILPTDEFPVWVTVGRVNSADGWYMSWTMLNFKTTSWDYGRWIYWTDDHIYYDTWTWTWRQVYTWPEVDALFAQLRSELSTVAFTWDYNDLLNRPVIPVMWDGILTITQNNAVKWTFTANQIPNWTINVVDTTYPSMTAWELGTWTDTTDRVVSAKVIADYVTWKVPTVEDNLTSTSTTNALSANQWRLLKWQIDDLSALWKFLSLRDATTWLPISFPLQTPYAYSTWDYFVVETVSTATPPVNYRPVGSSYDGTASSTAETDELEVWDVYIYDGSVWLLQSNHWKTTTFANIAWDPYDNTNLTTALNAKQDTLVSGTNIKTVNNTSLLWSGDVDVWDMEYSDFNFSTLTWASINLDLSTDYTPSANFTINKPSTLQDWQTYILRVNNGATAYTMTLGSWISNPYSTSLTLTPNAIDMFVFLAVWWNLELQPDVLAIANNATISITQWWTAMWDFTTNQSTNETIALQWNILATQNTYDGLPSSKNTDWNFYFIYSA